MRAGRRGVTTVSTLSRVVWFSDSDYKIRHRSRFIESATGIAQLIFLRFHLRNGSVIYIKLATLAYKALHTGQPPYLSELLQHYEPTRLCYLPLLLHSLFHDTTLNLSRVHFESQHQKSGIYCLLVSVFSINAYISPASKNTLFSVSLTSNFHPLPTRPDSL